MSDDGIWARLKKGRLVQVLGVYLAASWVVLQVVGELRDSLELPEWVGPLTFILLTVGLLVVLATAWVQSHPLVEARAAADEVPRSWELDVAEIKASLKKGEMPHLNWARAVLGGVFAFSLLFGFAGLYIVIQDRGRSFEPPDAFADAPPAIAVMPFDTAVPTLEAGAEESGFEWIRWWLARAAMDAGRWAEAERWLRSFHWTELPLAHYHLGKVYEELGNRDRAIAAYRYFAEAWYEADAELQPRVEEARQSLARLMDAPAGTR